MKALTYDDVAMVPKFNNIESRTEPDVSGWLTKTMKMGMPLLPSNMDTVINAELARVIVSRGGVPIFHRFYKNQQEFDDTLEEFAGRCFISWGVKDLGKLDDILINHNVLGVCLDVAHGHSVEMLKAIRYIKDHFPIEVIAGNICTPQGYQDLVNAGADAVKVGIGPGSACTTRKVTGAGVPQFTAVYEIGKVAKQLRVPTIADGAIKGSREVVLALGAGASTVMIGNLFANTKEAASTDRYNGQASESFQRKYFGEVKRDTVPEGISLPVSKVKSANQLIDELLGGLRSGMTYAGSRNIEELQRKFEYVEVTTNYSGRMRER